MAEKTRQRLQKQLADPGVSDEQNPAHLFSMTATDLLLAAVSGMIDPTLLARRELANRGLDLDGKWVGFAVARQIHGLED